MKVNEIINQARFALKDENRNEYSDSELMTYMSGAIDYLANLLASASSSYTKKSVTITKSPAALPDDFLAAAGIDQSIKIYDNTIKCEKLPLTFDYYRKYAHPKTPDDELELPSEFEPVVVQYIISRALLRNEYNVSAEQNIDNAFLSAVMEVARVRAGKAASSHRKDRYIV